MPAPTGPTPLAAAASLSPTSNSSAAPAREASLSPGGTNTATYYLALGTNTSGSGTYNLSAGQLVNGGYGFGTFEWIGESSVGTFNQSGGVNTVSDFSGATLALGYNAGSSGTYKLSGSGQISMSCEEGSIAQYVGYSGSGTFTQSGGSNSVPGNTLVLGRNAGGSGIYNLSGFGLLSAAAEYVGYSGGGTGLFQQSGGSNAAAASPSPAAACTSLPAARSR